MKRADNKREIVEEYPNDSRNFFVCTSEETYGIKNRDALTSLFLFQS